MSVVSFMQNYIFLTTVPILIILLGFSITAIRFLQRKSLISFALFLIRARLSFLTSSDCWLLAEPLSSDAIVLFFNFYTVAEIICHLSPSSLNVKISFPRAAFRSPLSSQEILNLQATIANFSAPSS
jgi:hypothetical protein